MAKRFTDTEKWKKHWIRKLPIDYKLFWVYILDDCNHAGIWDVDIEIANIKLGTNLLIEEILSVFSEKILPVDNNTKWFIPKFIEFQYGELNPNNKVHNSVISILKKEGAYKLLTRGLNKAKDKDKDKEKAMDKDKENNKADLIISYFNKTTASKCKPVESNREPIRARLNEGYTIDDCKYVIKHKQEEWLGTEWAKYITIETLFRKSKFDKYLNQKEFKTEKEAVDARDKEINKLIYRR